MAEALNSCSINFTGQTSSSSSANNGNASSSTKVMSGTTQTGNQVKCSEKVKSQDSLPSHRPTNCIGNNEKKQQNPPAKKQGRPGKAQMKQSSLETADVSLGRQDSWANRIRERTRRSRSTEDDYGDNTVDLSTSADLIEERLYLGNKDVACDIKWLKQKAITHILTIDSCPLPTKITDLPFVTTKYIQISDMVHEDILQYFEATNRFIREPIENEITPGTILVHCYYGVSRSATIVLAYLMHKYNISLDEALERLKSKRDGIGPNHGFLAQLKMYEKMGYQIDRNCPAYKRFRLYMAATKMKSVKVLPPPYNDVVRPDPGLFSERPEPVVYRCKKCRRILAAGSNLLLHKEGKTPRWTESLYDKDDPTVSLCTQMYFIEPIVWMREAGHNLQGKLHCPNALCKSKLGSFSWVMGCLCPCGAKVQPAFYLVPSKIDRSNSVLNLQITL